MEISPLDDSLRLAAAGLSTGYGTREVIENLGFEVPPGSFTVIIGPNACGKSTLLRALANLLPAHAGQVILNGENIARLPAKELARQIGILPQSPLVPEGITVRRLVAFGRHPYRGLFGGWTKEDAEAVEDALARTRLVPLQDRLVDELSGGQRQRVWIAMALAQQTELLLLDEPTTYLDIAHQIDILDLCQNLNRAGRTLVAVLHDLNQAIRYATHLVVMKEGRIIAEGIPERIVTTDLIGQVFGIDCLLTKDPVTCKPLVIPLAPKTEE